MQDNNIIEALVDKIKYVFTQKNYNNVTVQLENNSKAGDGYVAMVIRAIVSGERNGEKEVFDTIVKCAPKKEKIRKNMPTTPFFNREILYYNSIAPIYEKLLENLKIPDDIKCKFARCFVINDKFCDEFMILENLNPEGYKMMDRDVSLDFEHAEVAVKLLGKLHGLSYIFEDQDNKQFKRITSQLDEVFYVSRSDYNTTGICSFSEKALNKYVNCIENLEHKMMVKNAIGPCLIEKLRSLHISGTRNVISHGDFWVNNMLFKYKDNKPVNAVPLDFQICRYTSPANDFHYLMGISSEAELRRNYYWKLVNIYHESLTEILASCGLDVNDFCTAEEFKEEIKQQALVGLGIHIFALQFFTAGEVCEIHEIMAGNFPDNFHTTNDEFKTRANEMVTDYVNFGFFK